MLITANCHCLLFLAGLVIGKMSLATPATSEIVSNVQDSLMALVVDDSIVDRMVLTRLFESLKIKTMQAKDGAEAVAIVESGIKFDIILCDEDMPVKNGLEAVKEIKAMGISAIIIGVNCEHDPTAGEAFLNAGADYFIPKPVKKEKLVAVLEGFNLKL